MLRGKCRVNLLVCVRFWRVASDELTVAHCVSQLVALRLWRVDFLTSWPCDDLAMWRVDWQPLQLVNWLITQFRNRVPGCWNRVTRIRLLGLGLSTQYLVKYNQALLVIQNKFCDCNKIIFSKLFCDSNKHFFVSK